MRNVLSVFVLLILAALLLVPSTGRAQIPELKESTLENPRYPDWRSIDSLLSGRDDTAREYQEYLDELAQVSDGSCRTLDPKYATDEVDGINVRSNVEAAYEAAKYSAVGYISSKDMGIRSDGTFGTLLEIEVEENLSTRPFPGSKREGHRLYYFYPSFDFQHAQKRVCVMSSRVSSVIPEVGSRVLLFSRPDLFDSDPQWLMKESALFPLIFEDGRGVRTHGLPEANMESRSDLDATLSRLRSLKSSRGK